MQDEDGEYVPYTITHNRHEAWAWDEEKRIRWAGRQKASPTYKPTLFECLIDPIARHLYFGKDPAEHVRDRIAARKRHQILRAEHDEKHREFINEVSL